MQSTRLLPPQFLCPSWTPRQLAQLTQRRAYSGKGYRSRKWGENPLPEDAEPGTTLEQPSTNRDSARPMSSLFDELFPEEAQAKKKSAARKLGRLPAFKWRAEMPPIGLGGGREWAGSSSVKDPGYLKGLRKDPAFKVAEERLLGKQPAVLLVSALSKTLEESDFFRLSPKGEHIEGWRNGLIKVIQARDTTTLAPLSYYFLIFTSPTTANTYRENLRRIHALSKVTSFIQKSSMPLPSGFELKEGEDIDTLLHSFTLMPPTSPLAARFLKTPFSPFVQKMVEEGGHTALKEQQGKGDALVLLWMDTGRFSEVDVYEAIVKSGRERNLAWRLAGGKKDIEKLNAGVGVGGRDKGDEEVEGYQDQVGRGSRARARESRFVIALQDRHEVRRFVREWHRMPLPAVSRQTTPLVNVQMI